MGSGANVSMEQRLLQAYRALITDESRIAERLAPRGLRIGASIVEQWPTLSDYLSLYAGSLAPGGVLVLAGGPDDATRATGVPFTGAARARDVLGLSAPAKAGPASAAEAAFWSAVERASRRNGDAPLDSLFSTVHLAHARPFDVPDDPGVCDASARHVMRLLSDVRPQVTVAVGAEALFVLARALGDNRLLDAASIDESQWARHWPATTRLVEYPFVDVPLAMPYRMRLVPVASLSGPQAEAASAALASVFSYVWAA